MPALNLQSLSNIEMDLTPAQQTVLINRLVGALATKVSPKVWCYALHLAYNAAKESK
jgi:hypothetical protein